MKGKLPGVAPATGQFPVADLEGCLRDLVSVLALPSFCRGRSQAEALAIIIDSARTVLRATLVYAVLEPPHQAEDFWFADPALSLAAVRSLVSPALAAKSGSAAIAPSPAGGIPLRLVYVPIGFYAGSGALVIGSTRADFPQPLETVLFRAIASLTSATLDNARLLEAARESERRKDDFMALLGHELRNPLAPILTALQLMKLRNVGGEKERGIIERQARHMVQLVDDLFDISRITRGTVQLERRDLDLSDVIAQAVEMAVPLLDKHRHVLQVEVEPGLRLNADAVRLAQVFSNLLTNAARYTPEGGRIHIEAQRTSKGMIEVRVRDNGRGLEPHMLEKIFVLFFQTDRKKDALSGGLGLGLALVRSLVELHGGSVAASSAGLGLGSVFTVTLPALAVPRPISLGAALQPAGAAPVRRRVLVTDDNRDAADLLGEFLRAAGHEAQIAYDGAGALAMIASGFQPDFAILDLGLPGMDGYELAARLRAALPGAVLIALSGYTEPTARAKSLAAGFTHHLAKPADLDSLNRLLAPAAAATAPQGGKPRPA